MPALGWTRMQVRDAFTSSPWTRDFRHLNAIPRPWTKRTSWYDHVPKIVKPHDRIKYWNIVPGDQVRLLGDREGTIYQVNMINRLANRVLLRMEQDRMSGSDVEKLRSKNVPYSRCQLYIGRYEFPSEGAKPVFAKRLATEKPGWVPQFRRYEWKRYAVATDPVLPDAQPGETQRILVPWPKPDTRARPEATATETKPDAVLEVTYTPPVLQRTVGPDEGKLNLDENEYIRAISAPNSPDYNSALPYEIFLTKELSSPHSRAKKQARWKAQEERKRTLLKEITNAEIKNLDGRTQREATAEAVWKWRHQLEEERKAEIERRRANRGEIQNLERKMARKARKEAKRKEKLRNLMLPDGPNQVVPQAESRVS
ncbi:hypothetical protein WOLCODRAFT_24546 [Wolfiporia cocos MD-104 SS10]|uniref:KOW domain-containing protein n=1 Tax=Wolfiporia cocos (strain MD-104) TaxID=742152 RepID=A0A2H3JYF3_WOLCO|nr:hypothetical protein WOLCODRAFT_24546 [Wolfiporia cocos MD-104 SS10]